MTDETDDLDALMTIKHEWSDTSAVAVPDPILEALRNLNETAFDVRSPEGRTASAQAYELCARINSLARAKLNAIEQLWVRHMVGKGSSRLFVEIAGERVAVTYREPDAPWVTKRPDLLHADLKVLVAEDEISEDELALAVTPIVTYAVNNTKLNALARRSANAAAIIDQHRVRAEVNPLAGRVTFPRG